MNKKDDIDKPLNLAEWQDYFSSEGGSEAMAQLTANLMIATGYYHQRMKLHIMLHPLFFLAGFLTAYWAL